MCLIIFQIDELIETNQHVDLPSVLIYYTIHQNLDNSEIYYERVQAKQREYEKRKEDLKRKQDEEYVFFISYIVIEANIYIYSKTK